MTGKDKLQQSPTQWPPLISRIDWERLQWTTTLASFLFQNFLVNLHERTQVFLQTFIYIFPHDVGLCTVKRKCIYTRFH